MNNEEYLRKKLKENRYTFRRRFNEFISGIDDWFYSNYKDIDDFIKNRKKCKLCGKPSLGEFCPDCKKTKEFKKFHYEKIKQGMLKKHGVENPGQMSDHKEKIHNANIDYEKRNEKSKQTSLEKFGVEYRSQLGDYKDIFKDFDYTERNEKSKQTCLEKFGVDSYSKTDKFKTQIHEAFSKLNYEEINTRIRNTNLKNYGVESANQSHFINIENLNEEFIKENFIKDNKFLIDAFMIYFNILSNITANQYKEKFNITELNKSNVCKTQLFIFDSINIENKIFNDSHLGKELDVYLPDHNLAIEYDGLMFHSEGKFIHSKFNGPDKNYHLEKTELCLENNIQLLHIFETEDLNLWLSMINSKLGLNNKIFARKCIIKELKSKETEEFLNKNHLQGFCQAKINVGLFYEDELVSLMTFSKPRFNKKYEYELIRFASKRNYTVIGGASKLWKYFVNKYNPKSVITYANRRFSNGDLYYKLGFNFIEKTQPNYFYFKTNDRKLYNRVKFQKHKLKKILEIYDENLSEAENMFNNDYRKIYDCGNLKFEWIKE